MNTMAHKIVLIGDSGVGKSSMLTWLLYQRAENPKSATIGAAFFTKEFAIDNKKIKFNIWDTAGQERFRSVAKIYYRNTVGCFAVFDITNYESFVSLKNWIVDYLKENNDNVNIIIIANKSDMDKRYWEVKEADIIKLSNEYMCNYLLTSCINGLNIEEAFYSMGKAIINKNIIQPVSEQQLTILNHRDSQCDQC